MNLLTLTHLVHDDRWADEVARTLRHFGTRLQQIGRAVPLMAAALATSIAGIRQVIVVGEEGAGQAGGAGRAGGELRDTLRTRYLPFTISLDLDSAKQAALAEKLPFVAGMRAVDGKAAAYVCRNFTCQAPVTGRAALEKELV
jgi:hypothetical protein